jgi:hypothetical protein
MVEGFQSLGRSSTVHGYRHTAEREPHDGPSARRVVDFTLGAVFRRPARVYPVLTFSPNSS